MKVGDKVKIIGVNWKKANGYIGKDGVVMSKVGKDRAVEIKLKKAEVIVWFPESSLEKIESDRTLTFDSTSTITLTNCTAKKSTNKPPEFKVGDEVEIIGFSNIGSSSETLGDIGKIIRIDGYVDPYWVTSKGNPSGLYYPASSLKLITKEPEPKFKVGDRVKIGKNEDSCPTGDATVFQDAFAWGKGNYYVDVDGKKGIYTGNSWIANEKYMTLITGKTDTFYCCYVDGTGSFVYKHSTEAEAMEEAERLAKQGRNRGQKVHVLKVIASCEVPETPVQWNFK
jgi:hypothetical protein